MNGGGTEVGIQLYREQVKLQSVSAARAGHITGPSSIYSV